MLQACVALCGLFFWDHLWEVMVQPHGDRAAMLVCKKSQHFVSAGSNLQTSVKYTESLLVSTADHSVSNLLETLQTCEPDRETRVVI